MRRLAPAAALLLATLSPAPGLADAAWDGLSTPAFDVAGRREGLPHPIVTALGQDGDGFVWAGTQGGLARYDGIGFRTYRADPGDPGSLPDSYVLALHTDRDGRLWVGTAGGGAAWLDRARDRFVRVPVGEGGLPSPVVQAFADDGAGGVWAGTRGGLAHLPREGAPRLVEGLPDKRVMSLLRDAAGTLWVGTPGGLARLDGGGAPVAAGPAGLPARVLGEDGRGQVYVAFTHPDRDELWRVGEGGAAPVAGPDGTPVRLPSAGVVGLADAGGKIWLALQRGGVLELDPASGRTLAIRHDAADPAGLPDDVVFAIRRDRAGLVWLGTRKGLARHDPANRTFTSIRHSPLRSTGLAGADPMAVEALPDGRVLVGYLSGGIDVLAPGGGVARRLKPGEGGLPDGAILDFEPAGDAVYMAHQHGLARLDLAAGTAAAVALPGTDRLVHSVLSWQGRLWVGARAGLLVAEPGGAEARPFRCADGATPAAGLNSMALHPGPDGRLWIGTPAGVARLDPGTCALETLAHDPKDPASLPPGLVSTIHFDGAGRPWVGTMGGGIAVGGPGGGTRFTTVGPAAGLPSGNVGLLLGDGAGAVWASTADGIARVSPDLAVQAFGGPDGVSVPAYWVRSGAVTPSGGLLFGGGGGLTAVDPGAPRAPARGMPVAVTRLVAGGAELPPARTVTVPGTDRGLSVEFAALDYAAPGQQRYRFRLEGLDRGWTERDAAARVATYANLPPGDYTLRVQAAGRDGRWSEPGLSLPVEVLPAWHQTAWARMAAAAAALGGLAAVVRLRTRVLRRRQAELEREVAERTRDLRDANRRLERLAATDPLTGVLNRRSLMAALDAEWERARRYGEPFAVLLVDLDHFKSVNDRFGHAAGDAALCAAAERAGSTLRAVDRLGRVGGEEFAILLPSTDLAAAARVAERVRAAVAAGPVRHAAAAVPLSASVGVACWRPGDEAPGQVLHRADQALYGAKRAGRDQVVLEGA